MLGSSSSYLERREQPPTDSTNKILHAIEQIHSE